MKILLTGSIAYDRIMDFPGYFKEQIMPNKIHDLNVSFFVQDLRESFGGTAGNIAYNLSLLSERPSVLANVGEKDFAFYKKWLVKNKIGLSKIQVLKDQQTASAYIITDKNDNQITGFYPGAMLNEVDKSKINAKGVQLAVVSPQNPVDMEKLPTLFKDKKIDYIFDPGQQVASLTGDQLKQAITGSKILIGNDYEIALISKKTSWTVDQLLAKTQILITTLGSKGVMAKQGSETVKIGVAKRKRTLDPTGAGDAFRAGLIKGMSLGLSLKESCQLGTIVAVYAVEHHGTQVHKFTLSDIRKRYRQNFKDDVVLKS